MLLSVSRYERVMFFFLLPSPVFYAYATGTSASAEVSVEYAATGDLASETNTLHFFFPQIHVAFGFGGSSECVAAATAKVEIRRGLRVPTRVLRFLRL